LKRFNFSLKSSTIYLKNLSDFIYASIGPELNDKALTDEVVIAVDEAVTNIIIHAYKRNPDGTIRSEFTLEPGKLTIILSHQGHIFDPASIPKPDFALTINERQVNGMGMYIIQRFMDRVEYRFKDPSDPENHIILEKHLSK
jgi:anti-sigma regulatory factor (Ser/Thr protein kinase)